MATEPAENFTAYNAYRKTKGLDPVGTHFMSAISDDMVIDQWQHYEAKKRYKKARPSRAKPSMLTPGYEPFESDGSGQQATIADHWSAKTLTKLRTCAGYCDCPNCPSTCPHFCINGYTCCRGEFCDGA